MNSMEFVEGMERTYNKTLARMGAENPRVGEGTTKVPMALHIAINSELEATDLAGL